ncbi:MAG: peptidase M28, partial [Flavobacteriaceae bacterium]|nr:peptidase M28 [Flavobacteriaceae bacterium]
MKFLIFWALTFVGSCATVSHVDKIESIEAGIEFKNKNLVEKYANSITADELKSHVYILASDDFEGRSVGTP